MRIELRHTPKRSLDDAEVAIPEVIPILAPGQEWRSSWDNSRDRLESTLPDRHDGTVTFNGLEDKQLTSPVVLDWSICKARRWIEVYGQHDAAKALRDIRTTLKKWAEGPQGGLAVFTRDGDARDERASAQHAEWLAASQAERGARQSEQQDANGKTAEPTANTSIDGAQTLKADETS